MNSDVFAWIDLETTGLDTRTVEPLEIAIVVTDNTGKEICPRFESKIKPPAGTVCGEEAAKINGYNETQWADAPSLEELWYTIRTMTEGTVLAGHGVHYDYNVLKFSAERHGLKPLNVSHRLFDIHTLNYLRRIKGQDIQVGGKYRLVHGAMEDTLSALNSFREFNDSLFIAKLLQSW